MIWASAIIRIAVCLLAQNNWCTDEGNLKLSILRNGVFAVTGIGVIILYAISGNAGGYHMTKMVAGHPDLLRLLSARHAVQQNETQGGPADDSQDLRVYVDHRYGPALLGSWNS